MKNLIKYLSIIFVLMVSACCKNKQQPNSKVPIKDPLIYGTWRFDSLTYANNKKTITQLIDTINSPTYKYKTLTIEFKTDSTAYTPAQYHFEILGYYGLFEKNIINFYLVEIPDQALKPKSDLQPMFLKSLNAAETYSVFSNGTRLNISHTNNTGIVHFTKL